MEMIFFLLVEVRMQATNFGTIEFFFIEVLLFVFHFILNIEFFVDSLYLCYYRMPYTIHMGS